jgi:hypothetical protein
VNNFVGMASETKNVIFLIFNLAQAQMKHLKKKTRQAKTNNCEEKKKKIGNVF